MIPTDDDLNRAMAEAIGYRWYRVMRCTYESGPEGVPFRTLATEEQMQLCLPLVPATGDEPICNAVELPMFCSDRNSHHVIKQAIEAADAHFEFSREMRDVCIDLPEWSKSRTFTVTFAEPRRVVIAALTALGKMPGKARARDGSNRLGNCDGSILCTRRFHGVAA